MFLENKKYWYYFNQRILLQCMVMGNGGTAPTFQRCVRKGGQGLGIFHLGHCIYNFLQLIIFLIEVQVVFDEGLGPKRQSH